MTIEVDFTAIRKDYSDESWFKERSGIPIAVYDDGTKEALRDMKFYTPTEQGKKVMRTAIKQVFAEARIQAELYERLKNCFIEDHSDVIQCLDGKQFMEYFPPEKLGSEVALLGNGLAMTPKGLEIVVYELRTSHEMTFIDLRSIGQCLPSLKYLAKWLPDTGLEKVIIGRPITENEADWLVDAIQVIKVIERECVAKGTKKGFHVDAIIAGEKMRYASVVKRPFELVLADPQSYRLLVAKMTDREVELQDALKYAYKGLNLVRASRSPVDPTIHRALWCLAGRARAGLQDYDHAIKEYHHALVIDKNYVAATIDLGIAYENKKDYSKALQWYERSTEIAPEKSNVWYNLSCVCYEIWKISHKREFLQKGIQCMRASIKRKPERSDELLQEMLSKLRSC